MAAACLTALTLAILFVHPTPQLLPNGTAASAIGLRDTSGTRVDAVPSPKHQPVVVAFFETTCTSCRQKAVTLCTLAAAHPGISVVAIDSGARDAGPAAEFARRYMGACAVPLLLDPDLAVTRRYAVAAVPTAYIVDSAGRISYGGLGADGIDALDQHLPIGGG